MDCKELQEFYDTVTEDPSFMAYATMQAKFIELCQNINDTKITIDSEDKIFNNYVKFVTITPKMIEEMKIMWGNIDAGKKAELREEQRKAGAGTLEDMLKKIRK